MKPRRLFSLVVALFMFAAIAACGSTETTLKTVESDQTTLSTEQDKTESTGTEQDTPTDTTKLEATPSEPSAYDEHFKVSYAAVAMTEGLDYNADELSQHFLTRFNMEWDTIGLTWDNWGERVRIWVNAVDMPDFVMMNFNYTDIKNYADQGLLRTMPDKWEQKYPNLYKIHQNTGIGEAVEQRVGGIYMLPRIIYFTLPTDPLVGHTSLWYRKDWAESLGIPVSNKITVDEIINMSRVFKEKQPGDPDAGRLIPLSVSANDLAGILISPFNPNYSSYYKGEDGKYRWGAEDPETLEGLKIYRQAFDEGLLNPDFFALKNGEERDDFMTGRAGIMVQGGFAKILKDSYPKFEANTGTDPYEAIELAYVCNNDGDYVAKEITNYWSVSIFSPNMADEKFERLLDLLEYASTEEGQTIIRFGLEGIDWQRDAAGDIEIIRETIEDGTFINLQDKYPSLNPVYNNLTVLPDDFAMNDPTTDKRILDITKGLFDGKQKDGHDKGKLLPVDYDVTLFSAPNFDRVSIQYGDEFARLVVGEGDIEANWKSWIAEKRAQVDAVLDELNEAFSG